jgi:hypothetical protein
MADRPLAVPHESSCASTRRLIVSRRCCFQREDPLCRPARGWVYQGPARLAARHLSGGPRPGPRSRSGGHRDHQGEHPALLLLGNVCALFAAKDHVHVFLYDGAIVPDPEGTITAGPDNKTARTVTVRKARGSTRPRSVPCSGRLPTTGRAAGASALLPLAQARWRGRPLAIRPCRTIAHRNVSGTMVSDRDPSIRD